MQVQEDKLMSQLYNKCSENNETRLACRLD